MEYNYQTRSSSGSIAPLVMGILGMLLGIAGLIFGMQGKSRAISVENQIKAIQADESDKGTVQSRLTALERKFSNVGTANNALADQLDGLDKGLRLLDEQTRDALNQLGQFINENRRHIGGPSVNTGTASTAPATGGGSQEITYTPGGTYVIQEGDSFWKIANRMGISPAALEAANPDAVATGLQIGQTINLPQ